MARRAVSPRARSASPSGRKSPTAPRCKVGDCPLKPKLASLKLQVEQLESGNRELERQLRTGSSGHVNAANAERRDMELKLKSLQTDMINVTRRRNSDWRAVQQLTREAAKSADTIAVLSSTIATLRGQLGAAAKKAASAERQHSQVQKAAAAAATRARVSAEAKAALSIKEAALSIKEAADRAAEQQRAADDIEMRRVRAEADAATAAAEQSAAEADQRAAEADEQAAEADARAEVAAQETEDAKVAATAARDEAITAAEVRHELPTPRTPSPPATALAPTCAHMRGLHLSGWGRAVGGWFRGWRLCLLSPQPHQDTQHTRPTPPRPVRGQALSHAPC